MDFRMGIPYRIRRLVGPWINRLAKSIGQPSYHVRHTEYAGTVQCRMKDLEAKLQEDGLSCTIQSIPSDANGNEVQWELDVPLISAD